MRSFANKIRLNLLKPEIIPSIEWDIIDFLLDTISSKFWHLQDHKETVICSLVQILLLSTHISVSYRK